MRRSAAARRLQAARRRSQLAARGTPRCSRRLWRGGLGAAGRRLSHQRAVRTALPAPAGDARTPQAGSRSAEAAEEGDGGGRSRGRPAGRRSCCFRPPPLHQACSRRPARPAGGRLCCGCHQARRRARPPRWKRTAANPDAAGPALPAAGAPCPGCPTPPCWRAAGAEGELQGLIGEPRRAPLREARRSRRCRREPGGPPQSVSRGARRWGAQSTRQRRPAGGRLRSCRREAFALPRSHRGGRSYPEHRRFCSGECCWRRRRRWPAG
mmetsp:Transcript_8229/g.32436  ORF Transcript_8229/g.32436 Transcript_8229/m.32436 type:complete len:267 (+) Transcript_8229:2558-3358(+)